MGDAIWVNDPITGQGSNNALKAFQAVHDSTVARSNGAFNAAWMNATFERCWDYASTW